VRPDVVVQHFKGSGGVERVPALVDITLLDAEEERGAQGDGGKAGGGELA